ncbi:MAG: exopolyphosphatase/guanosine-5'-triphosphate,3'-diphosphate pyrophosphatase [Candidatus Endobugula sp.]|jgi:exopolyphosphatase/guanosine-5'-triphosphate,3'-diphosphate pyrophosphatase
MKERIAIIDLGTNTFHLFIVEISDNKVQTLYKEKIAVKIGKDGISKGRISAAAAKRAIHTLHIFKTVTQQFHVDRIIGVATSAIRSAKNGQQLLDDIKEQTGFKIEMISGEMEAELIFKGVKGAVTFDNTPQLVMDIGGGSVEFIIGNVSEIFWKQSFEIGAQRLLDKFHGVDPIPPAQVEELNLWLAEALNSLLEAIHQHQPKGLIGCSGTFDTLTEIYSKENSLERSPEDLTFQLNVDSFQIIYQGLITKNREERLLIPGMVSMRADMIVVATCLINFVLTHLKTSSITSCAYALKEGILFSLIAPIEEEANSN